MKTETMRLIDRYVGVPACVVMSWLIPIFIHKEKSNAVVVCKFFGIGSMCLSYPLICELKKQHKQVVYLTFAGNEAMAEILGADRCLSISTKSFLRFCVDVFKVIWQLRRIKPEAFLNLEFFSQFAALMSVMTGAPIRAGFHMFHLPVGKLYSHRANLNVYRSIGENFLNIAAIPGLIKDFAQPHTHTEKFSLPEHTSSKPAGLNTQGDRDYIVINMTSSDTIRDLSAWPSENWITLIGMLREHYPHHAIVMIGTEETGPLHQGLAALPGNDEAISNLIGQTTFAEFVWLIANADLTITVDSGPQHLSVLLKRSTVVLFGPDTPVLFGHKYPWVRNLYKNLVCSPCLAIYDAKKSVLDCRDNRCMKLITPQEVLDAALDVRSVSQSKVG